MNTGKTTLKCTDIFTKKQLKSYFYVMNPSHHSVKNWGLVATIVPSIKPAGLEVDEVADMNTSAIDLHILVASKIIIIASWWDEMLEEVVVYRNVDFFFYKLWSPYYGTMTLPLDQAPSRRRVTGLYWRGCRQSCPLLLIWKSYQGSDYARHFRWQSLDMCIL